MSAQFFYDFNSPYAYLAAQRVDEVLSGPVEWRPIAFGPLIGQIGKVPWSLGPHRDTGMRECEARAEARKMPRLRWPDGWPQENYSIPALRAALAAERLGALKAFSLAVFRQNFVHGRQLRDPDVIVEAAREAGVDEAAVRAGLEDPDLKAELRARTDAAIAGGVDGVPTVVIGERRFWGDDQLEDAAAHQVQA